VATIAEIGSLLRSVRTLTFHAQSEAANGWNGIGSGSVKVSELGTGVLVFEEAGTWRASAGADLRFTNMFRWCNLGQSLRLEHLRFGPEKPVFLFDLAPAAGGEWREVSPHVCRDDCYTASLAVEGYHLLVAWFIVGPRKSESIKYTYT
jgi:hypothetical protein